MGSNHRLRVFTVIATVGVLAAACSGDTAPVTDDTSDVNTSQASTSEAGSTSAGSASAGSTSEAVPTSAQTAVTATSSPSDAGSGDPDEPMGPEVTLTLGHPFPATHVIQAEVLDSWAQEVNEATNGTVTIEIIPAGGLGPAPAMYENTVSGAQDMGWALQGYTAGRFPLTQIVEMPFAFDTAQGATKALWDIYEEFPAFQAEYDDVHVLALWTHDTGDLWTAGTQITTTQDMAGLSLRAPGPLQQSLIEELGGTPVGMPAPEIYDSIERGVIDGLMISNSGIDSFSLYDVVEFGVDCNCYVAAMFLVMNQGAYDALSPAQQAVLDEMSGRSLSLRLADAYDVNSASAEPLIAEAGIELTTLSDEEFATWQAAGQAVAEEWIAAREAEGAPGQAMFDSLQELTGK